MWLISRIQNSTKSCGRRTKRTKIRRPFPKRKSRMKSTRPASQPKPSKSSPPRILEVAPSHLFSAATEETKARRKSPATKNGSSRPSLLPRKSTNEEKREIKKLGEIKNIEEQKYNEERNNVISYSMFPFTDYCCPFRNLESIIFK